MGVRRFSFAFGGAAAVSAALLLAGCASTGDGAADGRTAYAPMRVAGATIQMASLRGFQSPDPQEASVTAPMAAGVNQADANICRSAPPATGSRLGPRTMCMTGDEWESKGQNDRDQLTDAESRALASSPYLSF